MRSNRTPSATVEGVLLLTDRKTKERAKTLSFACRLSFYYGAAVKAMVMSRFSTVTEFAVVQAAS